MRPAKPAKSPHIRLAVESDPGVFITGYTNTKETRIRFEPKGFMAEGLFRFVMRTTSDPAKAAEIKNVIRTPDGRLKFVRGPVTVIARNGEGGVSMDVTVKVDDGETRVHLDADTCEEIVVRLDQITALFHTYIFDDAEPTDAGTAPDKTGTAHATTHA